MTWLGLRHYTKAKRKHKRIYHTSNNFIYKKLEELIYPIYDDRKQAHQYLLG